MNNMANNPIFSYELIDNKIPCGGFNLLGGGVKGRNIESKESQSLIFSLYADDRTDKTVTPQRLLVLNAEDYNRILPILRNPPSEAKVVATNLRFSCRDYYDYLQISNRAIEVSGEVQSQEELISMLGKTIHGNIVTLYDIANLYTKELGIKAVPWKNMLLDATVQKMLAQYYQLDNISFKDWIKKSTLWADLIVPVAYGIDQVVSQNGLFKYFKLDFTTEGNTLTYMPK